MVEPGASEYRYAITTVSSAYTAVTTNVLRVIIPGCVHSREAGRRVPVREISKEY